MRNIAILVEFMPNARFAAAMLPGMCANGVRLLFVTADLAIYARLKDLGVSEIFLVKKNTAVCPAYDFSHAMEVINGDLSVEQAQLIYRSTYNKLLQLDAIEGIDTIIALQGTKAAEIACKVFAHERQKKIRFYEIANLPGKMIFDSKGANAQSWLYEHVEILDQFKVAEDDFEKWRDAYLQKNFAKHEVKQAAEKMFKWKYGFLTAFGFLVTGLHVRKLSTLFRRFISLRFNKRFLKISYDSLDLQQNAYLFFPMQVSNDSQVIMNSDIGLFDALDYSIAKAKAEKLELVVKLHPAEPFSEVVEKILRLRAIHKFKLVNDNTFKVIARAKSVITINSTVALEAMIIGKEAEILGRSFFKQFNHDRMKNYILAYLINLDYFSEQPYTQEEMRALLERIDDSRFA